MILDNFIFPFDYIIISISFIIIIFSFLKGFVNSLLGLLTWVGSIIITIYSYTSLSIFINNQLTKIKIFNDYEQISNFISFIISIPVIFLFSLFLLRKLRKILSSDLDKQILGIIFDKFFGLIYGFIFSYLIISTLIHGLDHLNYFMTFNQWIKNNSYIISQITQINNNFLSYLNILDENLIN